MLLGRGKYIIGLHKKINFKINQRGLKMNILFKTTCAIFLFIGVYSCQAIAETTVEKQAKEHGYNKCLNDLADTANMLLKDHDHSSLSTWNSKSPNSHLFNSQVSIKYSDGNSISVINSTPNPSGKCDGSYSSIYTSEKSCVVLRETDFKDWKFKGEMAGLMSLEAPNGSKNSIFMPMVTGCVVVQTETYYDIKPAH